MRASARTTTSGVTCTMLRSDGEDEDELEDDDVSCPESDARSIDSERGGVELDSARIAETGAGPSAGTTC